MLANLRPEFLCNICSDYFDIQHTDHLLVVPRIYYAPGYFKEVLYDYWDDVNEKMREKWQDYMGKKGNQRYFKSWTPPDVNAAWVCHRNDSQRSLLFQQLWSVLNLPRHGDAQFQVQPIAFHPCAVDEGSSCREKEWSLWHCYMFFGLSAMSINLLVVQLVTAVKFWPNTSDGLTDNSFILILVFCFVMQF